MAADGWRQDESEAGYDEVKDNRRRQSRFRGWWRGLAHPRIVLQEHVEKQVGDNHFAQSNGAKDSRNQHPHPPTVVQKSVLQTEGQRAYREYNDASP